MWHFEKWLAKIEKAGSYSKIDNKFCINLCGGSNNL